MKQYRGGWGMRIGALLPAAGGFGTFYYMVVLAIQRVAEGNRFPPALLLASVPFGLFGLALGFYCLYAIADSFTLYSVDDNKIQAAGPFQHAAILWDQVAHFHTSGTTTVLSDSAGKRLRLDTAFIRDPNGELAATLKAKLDAVRQRQLQEMGWQTTTYRPLRLLAILVSVVALVFLGFGIAMFLDPTLAHGDTTGRTLLELLLGSLGLLSALFALHAFTWQLVVKPDSIESRSALRTRIIPFEQVRSVITRTVQTKGGPMLMTTVEGNGAKVTITDRMDDYPLIRDYIERKAGVKAVEAGNAAAPGIDRKERRQGLILISIVSVVGMGGMSLWFISIAQSRIARYDLIDRAGVHTMGEVTSRYVTGSRSPTYLVQFTFNASGREYKHSSPVSRNQYDESYPGQRVGVTYIPSHPDTCRLTTSIGREQAEGSLHMAYLLLVISLAAPVVAWFAMRKTGDPRPQRSDSTRTAETSH